MREYELMYIIAPNYGDDEACAAFAEQMSTAIANNGGAIESTAGQYLIGGRRKLAYTIRRESKDVSEGYYVLTRFQAEPGRIGDIERELKLADPVMRYLVTLANPESYQPVVEEEAQ